MFIHSFKIHFYYPYVLAECRSFLFLLYGELDTQSIAISTILTHLEINSFYSHGLLHMILSEYLRIEDNIL